MISPKSRSLLAPSITLLNKDSIWLSFITTPRSMVVLRQSPTWNGSSKSAPHRSTECLSSWRRNNSFEERRDNQGVSRSSYTHLSYPRCNDPIDRIPCEGVLVSLIARRSKETSRSLLALSLNAAVDKASVLTRHEFAELSLCFLLHYSDIKAASLKEFAEHIGRFAVPLLDDISREDLSYDYLASQSCSSIETLSAPLYDSIFMQKYGTLFAKGLTPEQVEAAIPNQYKQAIGQFTITCLNDPSKLQLSIADEELFLRMGAGLRIPEPELSGIYNTFARANWTRAEFIAEMSHDVPRIGEICDLWESTLLQHLNLTLVGKTLGHANLTRYGYQPDLSEWVK